MFNGCPDSDGDGITDAEDTCPSTFGIASFNGCPDTDSDSIADKDDKCPNEAGTIARAGCPLMDADLDGIEDAMDKCPNEKGSAATNGCPDSDGDGVANKDDKCPTIAASTSSGCPRVTTPVKTYLDTETINSNLNLSSRNINFETNSSTIRNQSFTHLDNIVNILNNNPSQNIYINGYTDNVGNTTNNQRLSEQRAKAAYDYLISRGISPDRMKYVGYGQANPIGSNQTANGRSMNRRIEVVLDDGSASPGFNNNGSTSDCSCPGTSNSIFQIPTNATPRMLTRLGTNPEFGNSHGLDGNDFYEKLKRAHQSNANDRKFLDGIFQAMGYSSFSDATPDMFSETQLSYGVTGNLGYSTQHKTLYASINAKLEKDLSAFRIRSANGCDIHFMKTCGNHFYFCTK